ncbi:MAG: acyl-CoA carboxylase subunit beta, partial [Dongiaceae bacterium]
ETLGGALVHTRQSGVADYLALSEPEAFATVRDIVAKLNWRTETYVAVQPVADPLYAPEEITGIINADLRLPYDVREIIARLVDNSDFQEFKPLYATTLICGTATMWGYPVGILGNNGVLFSESAFKATHFIEMCNQRHIPLLFLQNITGYMVGTEAEARGIAKDGAKMVSAVACARVPRFTVLIGGSYGAGNYGMCGRGFEPRFLFTWPTARCATMSAETAVTVMVDIKKAGLSGDKVSEAELRDIAARTTAQYSEQSDPYYATARLWDDGLIEPAQTRDVLGLCLSLAATQPPSQAGFHVYRM